MFQESSKTIRTDRVLVIACENSDGYLHLDRPDEEVGTLVDAGAIAIVRGGFDTAQALDLRQKIRAWAGSEPVFPPTGSANRPGLNFHRIDDGNRHALVPHMFHVFGFGAPEKLPPALRSDILNLSSSLLDLQNRLAGTEFRIPSDELKSLAMQVPTGGGFQGGHNHPYSPQKVGVVLLLSRPDIDYRSGGFEFTHEGEWFGLESDLQAGDVVIFRYDRDHRVSPIDPDAELNWDDDGGCWVFAIERFEGYSKSKLV